MTLRKLDYVLYLNAREWMNSAGIITDKEDEPMMTKEMVIDITGRDMPIIIRGFRPGPLFPSQMIPNMETAKGRVKSTAKGSGKKNESTESTVEIKSDVDVGESSGGAKKKIPPSPEEKNENVTHVENPTNGHRFIFVIAPESNPFSKKEDIARITGAIPIDNNHEVIIASSIVDPKLAEFPSIRNIRHDMLSYNPLRHSSSPVMVGHLKIEVIRDIERIKKEVLYDTMTTDLGGLGKIRTSVDPYTFWLDAHPGDVIRYTLNAEDIFAQTEYRHVTK